MLLLVSCTAEDTEQRSEELNVEVQQSTALRVSLEKIKNFAATNEERLLAAQEATELCFQFEYPVVLEYNIGTQVTVDDYEQLLDILLNETMDFHITSIGFPFNVVLYSDNSSATITNEADFQDLISNCGYNPVTVADVVSVTENCFAVQYPITLIINDAAHNFNSQPEIENYFSANTEVIYSINFQYPVNVTLMETGANLPINNNFELIYLINDTCGIN